MTDSDEITTALWELTRLGGKRPGERVGVLLVEALWAHQKAKGHNRALYNLNDDELLAGLKLVQEGSDR